MPKFDNYQISQTKKKQQTKEECATNVSKAKMVATKMIGKSGGGGNATLDSVQKIMLNHKINDERVEMAKERVKMYSHAQQQEKIIKDLHNQVETLTTHLKIKDNEDKIRKARLAKKKESKEEKLKLLSEGKSSKDTAHSSSKSKLGHKGKKKSGGVSQARLASCWATSVKKKRRADNVVFA